MTNVHILLVEPDTALAVMVAARLRQAGNTVDVAPDARTALAMVAAAAPVLIVTELALPDLSGLDLCRRIRASVDTTIIVASASAEEIDRVVAFEIGVDDFVAKPYSVRELVLRVGARLRRRGAAPPPAAPIEAGGLVVDPARFRVAAGGREVRLTSTEFSLLAAIARRGGAVVSRASLFQEVWERPDGHESRTIDTHVRRIREKLGEHGRQVETIRGVGYRLLTVTPAPRSPDS